LSSDENTCDEIKQQQNLVRKEFLNNGRDCDLDTSSFAPRTTSTPLNFDRKSDTFQHEPLSSNIQQQQQLKQQQSFVPPQNHQYNQFNGCGMQSQHFMHDYQYRQYQQYNAQYQFNNLYPPFYHKQSHYPVNFNQRKKEPKSKLKPDKKSLEDVSV
jgi:hypothetical protein